jgi:hypothetical protein
MYSFKTTIGFHKLEVEVVFWVQEGSFDGFYVLIPTMQHNILGYLSKEQIADLEDQAQRHYMEEKVKKNALHILQTD